MDEEITKTKKKREKEKKKNHSAEKSHDMLMNNVDGGTVSPKYSMGHRSLFCQFNQPVSRLIHARFDA